MPLNVVIIEDHNDFRMGLYFMLQNTEGFECTGHFSSVGQALIQMKKADLILLDIGLPDMSGIDGIKELRKKLPSVQIVMLTAMEDDQSIFLAVMEGANGYLLKRTPPAQILHNIEEAVQGGMPMTPLIAAKIIGLFKKYVHPVKKDMTNLTPREIEILALLVDGLNYKMIAEKCFISLDTVRNHIRHIYEKLEVNSKSQAVSKALRQGLL